METSNYHSHVQLPTSPVRRALFFDDPEEEAVPDDGDPNYEVFDESESESEPVKIPRQTFKNTIALQERFNRSDTEAALWWNMVSL